MRNRMAFALLPFLLVGCAGQDSDGGDEPEGTTANSSVPSCQTSESELVHEFVIHPISGSVGGLQTGPVVELRIQNLTRAREMTLQLDWVPENPTLSSITIQLRHHEDSRKAEVTPSGVWKPVGNFTSDDQFRLAVFPGTNDNPGAVANEQPVRLTLLYDLVCGQ